MQDSKNAAFFNEVVMENEVVILEKIVIEEAIPKFEAAWHKTVDALFEMIELIEDYRSRPGFELLRQELHDRGIIKESVMSMLHTIASNKLLLDSNNRKYLPPAYNTLYSLAKIDAKVLQKKFSKGEITPDLKLEQARQWSSQYSAKKKLKKTTNSLQVIASISMTLSSATKQKRKILQLLKQIETLGATVRKNPPIL
jgi:transcriptional regulator